MKRILQKVPALVFLGMALSFGARGQTYCTPVNDGGCSQQIIAHFEIEGTTLVNPSTCTEGSKYVVYPPGPSTTATLTPGLTYNFKIGSTGNTNPAQAAVWIDYNQNGTFEASEFTYLGTGIASPSGTVAGPLTTTAVNIPATAAAGTTRIRVRSNWESSPTITATDACTTLDFGETEDYTVTIGTLTPCSGTPSAAIASSVSATCEATPFNLSATPTGLSGVTYQFQKSTDGGATWTNLGTAGSSPFYTVTTQTVTTQYRVQVTCTASGGGTGTSTAITVTQNPATSCYCTPVSNGDCTQQIIAHFEIVGTSLVNPSTCPGGIKYTLYPATGSTTATLIPGTNYQLKLGSSGNGNPAQMGMWVDLNQNGVFETTEFTYLAPEVASPYGTTSGPLTTVSYALPSSALPGTTRIRVRSNYNFSPVIAATDACTTLDYGETEDYIVTIVAPTPCSGTPAATIAVSPSAVCAGTPITLTAAPVGLSGVTYQFQKSTDGGATWINLGTASTDAFYVIPSQTETTEYRVKITCSATGGGTGTSTAATVTQNPYTACYCTPTYTTGCTYGDDLDGFVLNGTGGTAINHTGTGCSPGAYGDYTSMSVSLLQGFDYPGTIMTSYSSPYENYRIWIDFNDNGLFEASESLAYGDAISASAPGSFLLSIPATAPTGNHRMRVRLVYSSPDGSSIDPCDNYSYGETHDYMVNIIAPVPCSGTPVAGLTATVTTTCGGVPFTLNASPSDLSGLSYQYQVSTDGGGTWSNLGTATTAPYYNVPSQTVASQYRVIITCSGGTPATSAAVSVAQNPYEGCYCTPGETYTWDNYFTNVNFAGINNPSGAAPMGYADYTSTVPAASVSTGASYPITVNLYNPWGAAVAAWIDFDHSGTFDSDEFFELAPGSSMMTTVTGNITIDPAALAGPTRMRLRTQYSNSLMPTDACNDLPGGYNEGETEDYLLNIAIATPCSGTPVATLSASDTALCSGIAFNLMAGPTGMSGLTFQYQSSTDGTTWTNLGASTAYTFYSVSSLTATTQYRVIVSCAGGGSDTSAAVTVTQNPATECYCTPLYSTGCSFDDNIENFIIAGDAGSGINHLATGCSPGGYGDYTDSVLLVTAGNSYTGTLTTLYSGSENFVIWADFNQNGLFESTEQLVAYGPFGSSDPANFTMAIPATAPNGTYRMRVRLVYSESAIDPCISYSYGETHDYTLQVGLPCALSVSLGTDTTICAGTPLLLNATTSGATYLWSTGDNTASIAVTEAGTYWVKVSESGCTATDTITVSAIPMPAAGTINTAGSGAAWTFSASGYSGGTYTWYYGDGTTGTGVTTVHTYTANGNYNVMFVAANSCGSADTTYHTLVVSGLGIDATAGKPVTLQVYPNPSNGLTVVEAEGAVISAIEVVDNLGRVLLRSHPNTGKTTIDVHGMAQGIYTLRIQTNKGSNTVKLVVHD